MKTQLTVIGTNHGKKVSRIWIEGPRLVEAGFVVGARYDRTVKSTLFREPSRQCIMLTLAKNGKYKVSGKGEKPIIDTTGRVVREVFPDYGDDTSKQVVEVCYEQGHITMRGAKK